MPTRSAPDDHRFDSHGITVVVDPKSLPYLDGHRARLREGGLERGLQVQQPQREGRVRLRRKLQRLSRSVPQRGGTKWGGAARMHTRHTPQPLRRRGGAKHISDRLLAKTTSRSSACRGDIVSTRRSTRSTLRTARCSARVHLDRYATAGRRSGGSRCNLPRGSTRLTARSKDPVEAGAAPVVAARGSKRLSRDRHGAAGRISCRIELHGARRSRRPRPSAIRAALPRSARTRVGNRGGWSRAGRRSRRRTARAGRGTRHRVRKLRFLTRSPPTSETALAGSRGLMAAADRLSRSRRAGAAPARGARSASTSAPRTRWSPRCATACRSCCPTRRAACCRRSFATAT